MVTWVAFEESQVHFTRGKRKIFESSPGRNWGFCSDCGTSLTWEGQFWGKAVIEFHISLLENAAEYKPRKHWYDEQRLPWFEIVDDLPRYQKNDINAEPTHRGPKS